MLIPLSIVLLTLAGAAFFWAVDNDQYDDLDTPALMPLGIEQMNVTPYHDFDAALDGVLPTG